MKTAILAFLLLASNWLKADAGSSIVYQAKFFLKNGEKITGFFEMTGYTTGLNENYTRDKGIQELVKEIVNTNKLDSFTFFRKIQYPKYLKGTGIWTQKSDQLGAVATDDVVKLTYSDINFMVFLSAKDNPRDAITTGLLVAPQEWIDKFHSPPLSFWETGEDNEGFVFYNFNPKNNRAEIERLYKMKKKSLWKEWSFDKFNRFQGSKWNQCETKKWFLERGIVIVETRGTC